MNMPTPNNLEELKKDAEPAENPTLKRLMKTWESKQARTARKAGGLGVVAVSLAACGSDSDDGVAGEPETPEEILGNIFTLTTSADDSADLEPQGDSGIPGDIFNAPLADASGSLQGLLGIQTLGGQDIITGTDEVDVLNAELNATGTTQNPTITDVEILNLTVMPLPALGAITPSFGILDLSRSEGYEQLWNIDSNFSLTLTNVDEGAAIGLDGTAGNTTYTINYTSSATPDIGSQTVLANEVGGSTQTGLDTDLNITDASAGNDGIEDLNLVVSNGVRMDLQGSAANIENLVIEGDGDLVLSGVNQFPNLVMLDSTGYDEGLDIDVSGSTVLTEVGMGDGGDRVVVNDVTVRNTLSANMGAGADTFAIDGVIDDGTISALDFTGGVSGAQTLEFTNDIGFIGNGALDLDDFADLETISFEDFEASSNAFTVENAPETLLMTAANEFEMVDASSTAGDGAPFTIDGVVNLTMKTTGAGDSDVRITNGVNSETLENFVINAADDAYLFADRDLDALTSIETKALGDDAKVQLDNFNGDEFGALASVSVTAADDANLIMNGRAPVQQVQTFEVSSWGLSGLATLALNVPGSGVVAGSGLSLGALVGDLNTNLSGTGYTASLSGGDIDITKVDPGPEMPITIDSTTTGGFGSVTVTDAGLGPKGVDGAGFEALEDVVVTSEDDATVNLTDVYGSFDVAVTAEGDANGVTLTNTNAESVEVNAGTDVQTDDNGTPSNPNDDFFATIDTATVNLDGGLHGNPNLSLLEVSGAQANVTLSDDLSSMSTIDLRGVEEQFGVDASSAEYAEDSNVFYMIGGTSSDITNQNGDSSLTFDDGSVESVREIATFTEGNFGTVVINNFEASSADPTETDRIDLSDLGFTNEGQLDFEQGTYDGNGVFQSGNGASDNDYQITDGIVGDDIGMGGEIVVTGVGDGNVDDLQSNMVYA